VRGDRGDGRGGRLATAIAELYGADPETFTARRAELTAAARGAGDRTAAKAIGALRRPTRAAWVVNQLARADPGAPSRLAELGSALRAAQEAGHGPRLRELSAARGALVDALTAQALALAGVPGPPPSLRLEVSETLTAALADPEVAAAFAAGTLTRAVQWSGFGVLPAGADADSDADAGAARAGPESAAAQAAAAGGAAPVTVPAPRRRATAAAGAAAPAQRQAQETQRQAAEAERQAAEAERQAREAAERAARRRDQYAEAERSVAAASQAAAEALSAEDLLETEVRDLEQRLTQARADLAAARLRARHAEAAERRARQAFDRLPGP
jgi:hypothetical protein